MPLHLRLRLGRQLVVLVVLCQLVVLHCVLVLRLRVVWRHLVLQVLVLHVVHVVGMAVVHLWVWDSLVWVAHALVEVVEVVGDVVLQPLHLVQLVMRVVRDMLVHVLCVRQVL